MKFYEYFIFNVLNNLAGQFRLLDWLGIFLAKYLGYFLIIGAVVLIFKTKNFKEKVYNFALAVLSILLSRGILIEIIRVIYHRSRPFEILEVTPLINHDAVAGFPSGHAAFYFALAFAVFFLNRKIGLWYVGAAILIGLARVFAGVHWPLDIVGGAAVAFISVLAIRLILASFNGRRLIENRT
jgi:undecaprenyl-diphosphatase